MRQGRSTVRALPSACGAQRGIELMSRCQDAEGALEWRCYGRRGVVEVMDERRRRRGQVLLCLRALVEYRAHAAGNQAVEWHAVGQCVGPAVLGEHRDVGHCGQRAEVRRVGRAGSSGRPRAPISERSLQQARCCGCQVVLVDGQLVERCLLHQRIEGCHLLLHARRRRAAQQIIKLAAQRTGATATSSSARSGRAAPRV